MKSVEIDTRKFGDDKILKWEETRYRATSKKQSLMEQVAGCGRGSNSLRFRLQLAIQLLTPHIEGRRIVELGCGSGLIAEALVEF